MELLNREKLGIHFLHVVFHKVFEEFDLFFKAILLCVPEMFLYVFYRSSRLRDDSSHLWVYISLLLIEEPLVWAYASHAWTRGHWLYLGTLWLQIRFLVRSKFTKSSPVWFLTALVEIRQKNRRWLVCIVYLLMWSNLDRRRVSVTTERLATLVIVQGDIAV